MSQGERASERSGVDHDRSVAGAQRRDRGPGSRGSAAGAWAGGRRPRPARPARADRDGTLAAAQPRREPGRGARGRGADRFRRFTGRSSRPGRRSGRLADRTRGPGEVRARLRRGPVRHRAGALVSPPGAVSGVYALFVGLLSDLAVPPVRRRVRIARNWTRPLPLRWLAWLGESVSYWWPVGPILLVVLFDRLGAVGNGGAVSGGDVELAAGFSPG